ncbi:MAG: hypothetical protein [Caudoviricetes sp.]|nr:MAG: hypothetical protein [Caudoviricetes sp.]
MKVSEVLQAALDNHYCNGDVFHQTKAEFMCHAVHYLLAEKGYNSYTRSDAPGYKDTIKVIEDELCGAFTLHSHLLETNNRYKSLKERYGADAPSCFKIRQKFWKDLIAKLVAEDK